MGETADPMFRVEESCGLVGGYRSDGKISFLRLDSLMTGAVTCTENEDTMLHGNIPVRLEDCMVSQPWKTRGGFPQILQRTQNFIH